MHIHVTSILARVTREFTVIVLKDAKFEFSGLVLVLHKQIGT